MLSNGGFVKFSSNKKILSEVVANGCNLVCNQILSFFFFNKKKLN